MEYLFSSNEYILLLDYLRKTNGINFFDGGCGLILEVELRKHLDSKIKHMYVYLIIIL